MICLVPQCFISEVQFYVRFDFASFDSEIVNPIKGDVKGMVIDIFISLSINYSRKCVLNPKTLNSIIQPNVRANCHQVDLKA